MGIIYIEGKQKNLGIYIFKLIIYEINLNII
jgi:hypothetical protein